MKKSKSKIKSKAVPAKSKPKAKAQPVKKKVVVKKQPKINYGTPVYFTKDGRPDKRYGISKFFTKQGKPDKRYAASANFKANGTLKKNIDSEFLNDNTILKKEKKRIDRIEKKEIAAREKSKIQQVGRGKASGKPGKPTAKKGAFQDTPWLKGDGTVDKRLQISKYLTKDGKLRKGVKLPVGIEDVDELWDYLESEDVEVGPSREGLTCIKLFKPFYEMADYVEENFYDFEKVFMGEEEQKTLDEMMLYIDDYIDSVKVEKSPPRVYYHLCDKTAAGRSQGKYLFF